MTGHIVVPGLTPSTTLTPSTSLVPQSSIYSGGPITPHQIALACGTGGAYVDVTSFVEFGEGVGYGYGRSDQFSDPVPGTFGFTLNNSDGRFTPGNTSSPLATTVTEGMGVSWLLGTRLVHTSILAVEIPASEDTWYQLRVTCDDMLGDAGRHGLTSIADGLTATASPQAGWKLDEDSSAYAGADSFNSGLGAFLPSTTNATSTTQLVTFGQPQVDGLPGTAVTVTAAPGETTFFGTRHANTSLKTNIAYPIPTDTTKTYYYGWWNVWVYPGSTCNLAVIPYWAVGAGYSDSMQLLFTPTTVGVKGGTAAPFVHTYTTAEQITPHRVSMRPYLVWQTSGSYWALFLDLWMDGTYLGNAFFQSAILGYPVPAALLTAGTAMQPLEVDMSVTNPAGATGLLTGTFQRVTHTLNGTGLEENALLNVEDQRRAVLDTLSPELSSAAYNGRASLSTAPIGYPDISGRSILDVYNDIVRTEQGHLFCTTSGTLLAPVEQIQVRDRDRPTNVKAVFRATDQPGKLSASELDGLPAFVRDITNVAESVDVAGPADTVTVTDPTVLAVTARAVKAGLSETVLFANSSDLRLWGQDRIVRGKNIGIRVTQFTVDAVTTPVDRSSDLLKLVPGDRIQLTGLPATVLGFSTWDGWVIGATESHTYDGSKFTFTVAPVLPDPAVYDTARYANGGAVTLATAMTAAATTMTVTSTIGATMSTDVPYTITVAAEQCTVTAVSGNTLTVTRGVNGTTAVAHTTADAIELASPATYVF